MHNLNSNFIVHVDERLSFNFKKQYTYFLHDNFGITEQPSFDSFKQFLSRELQVVKTTFAERFLCSFDRGEKNRCTQRAKVHHTNVQTSPFGLFLQSGVATAYHHSLNLSVFNIRLLCTNFPHLLSIHLKIFSLVSLFSSFLVTPFPSSFFLHTLGLSLHDMSIPPQPFLPHLHS